MCICVCACVCMHVHVHVCRHTIMSPQFVMDVVQSQHADAQI